MRFHLPLACAALWAAGAEAAALPSCLPEHPVPVTVRIGANSSPTPALLHGGVMPKITLEERDTGRILWTAADAPPATQQFPAMQAAFSGSFTVVDLDGDGVHDRLYAGDMAGRLWRFDLHQGVAPEQWASGGVWADFSTLAGRGFLVPPDVSLSAPPGQKPWFNIAAGTARTTDSLVANRFYVVRDKLPFDTWSDSNYRAWKPLRETDLRAMSRPGSETTAVIDKGYYFELGTSDVMAPSLTISGRATLALSTAAAGGDCQLAVSVASFDIDTAASIPGQDAPSSAGVAQTSSIAAPAGTGFVLTPNEAGKAECTLGGTHVAACDVDTRPTPLYWRREDAD